MSDLSHMKNNGILEPPAQEYLARRAKVNNVLQEKGLEGMVFFSSASIFYLTGSALIPTERPIAYIYRSDGESTLFVPLLELEHAQDSGGLYQVESYPEYPDERHPMHYLADVLGKMKLASAAIAADGGGYPGIFGYRGPSLTDVCPELQITMLPQLINELKIYKSAHEIRLMKESARWGHFAHTLLQEYTHAGLSELEVVNRASSEATSAMLRTLGPYFRLSGVDNPACYARYRGQIGPHSYFPHSVPINAVFKTGDTLVTGAVASVLGYRSELERVMFVGEPSQKQEHFYNLAIQAQDAAFAAIKPGKLCSEVDAEMRRFFRENKLEEYWRHHTGHAIGTGAHEAPFFDIGDHTLIEPGMCFTVEPGLYVKGLGGFRLSDTLVVTEDGFELITYYARNIESLICR